MSGGFCFLVEFQSKVDPVTKIFFGAGACGFHEDESFHGAAGKIHFLAAFFLEGCCVNFRVDARHQFFLKNADAHFVVDHKS